MDERKEMKYIDTETTLTIYPESEKDIKYLQSEYQFLKPHPAISQSISKCPLCHKLMIGIGHVCKYNNP